MVFQYLERINEVLNDAAPEELEAAVRRLYEFSLDSARRVDPELPGKLLEEQLERVAGSSISSIRSEPGDGGRRQFTITVPKVEAAAAIAETQETIGDDTSEPTTLDTDNISVATSGSHQRLQPLHEALSGVRVTFGHATRGGADFVIVSPKTAKDIEKDMKGIFSREGVYRLHELIEQHNSELRYPDGPETAIRAEKAATAKDTPREVKPLLRAFATFKRADTMQKQELRSLKTHLGMLAFLQEYDKLNEMMDEKSPSYNERLKQSLEMSRGRNCKSVVMDYLVILTKEDRHRVKHNLVEARALDKMTYAFGGKGVLCLIHSSMPSRYVDASFSASHR